MIVGRGVCLFLFVCALGSGAQSPLAGDTPPAPADSPDSGRRLPGSAGRGSPGHDVSTLVPADPPARTHQSSIDEAPDEPPPFRLPFAGPPGPDTWLLEQAYGNTVFAFRERTSIYWAGQGLHFGVDLAARCGTPVLAIGDGIVDKVDSIYHGAGPHSVMIDHPNGYASFYGHLLARSQLVEGQQVKSGEVVGLSGDPDLTCTSRPHLHLEIRNAPSHGRAFNPLSLIDADWDRIALIGAYPLGFEQDLSQPSRWIRLGDQPDIIFGEHLLNEYPLAWPPDW